MASRIFQNPEGWSPEFVPRNFTVEVLASQFVEFLVVHGKVLEPQFLILIILFCPNFEFVICHQSKIGRKHHQITWWINKKTTFYKLPAARFSQKIKEVLKITQKIWFFKFESNKLLIIFQKSRNFDRFFSKLQSRKNEY